jgi:hypothetical protein
MSIKTLIFRFLILIILLLISANNEFLAHNYAQSSTNNSHLLNNVDQQEALGPAALQLVARFTSLLQKSSDFEPIVAELFTPDYLDCQKQLLIDRSSLFFRDLNVKLEFTGIPDAEVKRYQLTLLKFFHLQLLINDHLQQKTDNPVNILEELPKFAQLMESETSLRTVFHLEKAPPLAVRSVDEWRKLNDQLDKVVKIFADYLTAHPVTKPLSVIAPEFFTQVELPCNLSSTPVVFVQVPIDNFLPLPTKPVAEPENDQIRHLYAYLLVCKPMGKELKIAAIMYNYR